MVNDPATERAPVVVAVVVTYEEPARLGVCLDALLAQSRLPDRIVVVNNGAALPVGTLPQSSVLQLIEGHGNLGPAGGFSLGIEQAMALRADWVWALDDDFAMPPHALADLLALGTEPAGSTDPVSSNFCMVWPTQLTPSGVATNYPGWCGVFIGQSVIAQGGLPRAELVWWVEDTEYLQWRLPRTGALQRRSATVCVVHGDARPDAVRPAWKTYYEVRNTVWYRLYVRRSQRWRIGRVLVVTLAQSILTGPRRRARAWAWARGCIDGLRGRLGLRYPLPGRTRT